jgi:GTP-binding protein
MMHAQFHAYLPKVGAIKWRSSGFLVSWETGAPTNYGIKIAEERGILLYDPGVEIYEGMMIGEH